MAASEVVREVVRLERGPLHPETLGLSLAEARSILAGLEQTLVEQQSAEFIAQQRRCPRCGRERPCKGHHQIVFRTPFGKLKLDSRQLYGCPCQSPGPKSVSPLAERLPERTSPELTYLETKFSALVSYGLSLKLLNDVLPIGQHLSVTATAQVPPGQPGRSGRSLTTSTGQAANSTTRPAVLPSNKRVRRVRPAWP